MEERAFHPIADDNGNFGLERYLRDIPPAHYTLKIDSFSALSNLLQDAEVQNYESEVFESNGFKWKLSIYPNGNNEGNGEGHVSLYLVIADTDNLPLGWEVYASFKLFVYDQIQDKYMTIQDPDRKVRRFHQMKKEWGFDQFLPLSSFNDATKGYLVRDKCVFGAEVFVINYSGRGESVAVLQGLSEIYTWKIEKFSSLEESHHYSDVFTRGNQKWKLLLYPKGDSRELGKSLSLFIELADKKSFPSDKKVYAKYLIRVWNQTYDTHVEIKATKCFSSPAFAWGRSKALSLSSLHNTSAGFLVNDTLIVDAQIECICAVKNFSK